MCHSEKDGREDCEKGEAGEKEWKCEKGKGEKDDKVEGVRRVN
jgi:hypothetical protein